MDNKLKNCEISSVPFFSLDGIQTYCRLIDVYDGDTITCIIPLFDNLYKFSIRLNGIDTPELKTKIENVKNSALDAKHRVISLTTNKVFDSNLELKEYLENNPIILWIHCYKSDKYGRILANVYINRNDNLHISNILINENLAVPYDGKTKTLIH